MKLSFNNPLSPLSSVSFRSVIFCLIIFSLFSLPKSAQACDRASLALDSVVCEGNNYRIYLNLCLGGGITGSTLGAADDTRTIAFGMYSTTNISILNFAPASITGNSSGITMPGANIGPSLGFQAGIAYLDPGGPTGFMCVSSVNQCGNIHTQCDQYNFLVNAIPDSIRLFGAEGNGTPLGGCYPNSDMMVDFTQILQPANAGPDTTICQGDTVSLGGPSNSNGTAFLWSPASSLNNDTLANPLAFPQSTTTYTLVSGVPGGCLTTTDQVVITVGSSANVAFSGLDSAYCQNANAATLLGTPSGGTFSGPGISGTTFDPAQAGPGTHTIVYSTNNGSGCGGSDTSITLVTALPNVSFTGLPALVCESGPPVTLTGIPPGGTFSGPGMSGNTFDPAQSGPGTQTITYSYTNGNGCSNTDQQTVQVDASTTASFTGLSGSYCAGDPTATLTGIPPGGIFSGTGVTGNIFDPSVAGDGSHTIVYIYADSNNCSDTSSQNTQVNALPTVLISGLNSSYCESAPPVTLSGTPTGGVFSGNGVSGSTFDPAVAGPGQHTISYVYTDSNGCSNSDSIVISVNPSPTVFFTGLTYSYCTSDPSVNLTPNPAGGIFSGPGVTGNSFDPGAAGVGSHTIVYEFTDNNNCTGSFSDSTQVDICNGLGPATSLGISLYPNPNQGEFVLQLPREMYHREIKFQVWDNRGRLVHQSTRQFATRLSFSLGTLSLGAYTLVLQTENHTPTYIKFLVRE